MSTRIRPVRDVSTSPRSRRVGDRATRGKAPVRVWVRGRPQPRDDARSRSTSEADSSRPIARAADGTFCCQSGPRMSGKAIGSAC
eukprot:scaffold5769_cov402-Prasinococcus_capsulatus_cf.AAC.6